MTNKEKVKKIEVTTHYGQWAWRGDLRTMVEKINEIVDYINTKG